MIKGVDGARPSTTEYSDSVAHCSVEGSKVELIMAKDASSVDFFVDIIGAGPFVYTDSTITGKLRNFGTEVLTIDEDNPPSLPQYSIE